VTALDMKGFSLTAIVLEESIEKALLGCGNRQLAEAGAAADY
jgi:dihydroxyacetone kinase